MKKFKIGVAGFGLLLLVAFIYIVQAISNDRQAILASVLDISFHGEYKIQESDWQPIEKGQHIPASDGEVILRGTFLKSLPDGEIVGQIENGERVALFFDHIGANVGINGAEPFVFEEFGFTKNWKYELRLKK